MKRIDPLGCDTTLGLSEMFYPAGFPLHLETNSRQVLEAAAESWKGFSRQFDTPPLGFRVVVEAAGGLAGEPTFRKQAHLLCFVSDGHNFSVGDSLSMTATFHLSQDTAGNSAVLRWFYLEAMAYMLLTQRYVVSVHAACVARGNSGILLCGKSGAGKSTLAMASARAGFTYVADDCTWLLAGSRECTAIGKPQHVRFRHDAARHFAELEGHLARTRPGGKVSIEVPTDLFPSVNTASTCRIGCLVFLDREGAGPAGVARMDAADAVEMLLAEMPSYGPEVNAIHEEAIQKLAALPAWRLCYRSLEDGIRLLGELAVAPDEAR